MCTSDTSKSHSSGSGRHHRRERRSRHRSHSKNSSHSRKRRENKCKNFICTMLQFFIQLIHRLIDSLLNLILSFYWGEKKVCPSLEKNVFLTKSGTELAQLIREKQLTSFEVVSAYIDRLKEVNPLLNAVVDGPFMEALDEAKAIDKRIENDDISDKEFNEKPYLGIPFTTKDSTAVGGKLHTLGLVSRKKFKAKEDAECVRLLKEAGAIIIATTNIPELNRWQETRNLIIGQTNNPYDIRRTTGGSSGGEAALVASCGTGLSLGTDIGGSIRMPAFYCGIFGHKPTVGIVNTRGCTMRTGKEDSTMVVAGPMSRHAADLLPMMKILIEPSMKEQLNLDKKPDVKSFKYYYIMELGDLKCSPVSGDMNDIMLKAVDHFANIAEDPPEIANIRALNSSSKLWRYWMTKEPADFVKLAGNGKKLNPLIELFKKLFGQSEFTWAMIYNLVDTLLPKGKAAQFEELTKKMTEDIENLLGDDGILLFPSTTNAAPYHYMALFKIYNFSYFSILNVLKFPVTQVPMGLNSDGLPLGIQVVATKNRDVDCLAVAEELEKTFGGWVPPFTINCSK